MLSNSVASSEPHLDPKNKLKALGASLMSPETSLGKLRLLLEEKSRNIAQMKAPNDPSEYDRFLVAQKSVEGRLTIVS